MSDHYQAPVFQPDPDGINPQMVPVCALQGGAKMPAIGLGTFGSDHASAEAVADAVVGAAAVGYRHFDCAAVYRNEDVIGKALASVQRGGVKRADLWITSKLWNDSHAPDKVAPAFRKSLDDLGLDYLDLYLVHWPFPNSHAPGCTVASRYADARPYIHTAFMRTWRELEKLVEKGLVRHIGTSNMTVAKLQLVLRDAAIKPTVNEMELHPHFQQPELFRFVQDNGMVPVGYCPLGSPGRPERDRTPEDTSDLEDPVLVDIAARHGVHPVAISLKWAVQRGQVPIPMSTKRNNYLSNLQAVCCDPLSSDEMAALARIDRNCRLIKGHVFLWKENQPWEDLWDPRGVVVGSDG